MAGVFSSDTMADLGLDRVRILRKTRQKSPSKKMPVSAFWQTNPNGPRTTDMPTEPRYSIFTSESKSGLGCQTTPSRNSPSERKTMIEYLSPWQNRADDMEQRRWWSASMQVRSPPVCIEQQSLSKNFNQTLLKKFSSGSG